MYEESKAIRFEGDGYSDEWVKEAEKRGLSNVKDTARALDFYVSDAARDVFKRNNIMTDIEIDARHEIMLENYIMKLQIESRVMGDLALNHILPTAIAYQNKLIQNAQGLKELGIDNSEVIGTIEKISEYASSVKSNTLAMIEARKKANEIEKSRDRAIAYCDQVKEEFFEKIRYAVDKLELFVDDEDWPLVKYRELLFIR